MPSEDQQTSPLQPIPEAGTQSPPGTASPGGDAAGQPETGQQSNDAEQTEPQGISPAASQQDVGSPIQRQHRDERLQPDHFPAKILFLSGTLKGLELDLGVATNEVSHSQSANFETPTEEGVRVGTNFKQLSPRSFSFKLEFYDLSADIQHLVENCAHLQEIDPATGEPPQLMMILGAATIAPCRCTNLRSNLSEPHAKRKGYRYGQVEIEIEMYGGKESEHALGKPLVATPLGDERARQTEAERQRQGTIATVELLLEPCLGEEGSQQLTELIEDEQLSNSSKIAALDDATFLQAAIAGFFPTELLQDPILQEKLVTATAEGLAESEYGTSERDLEPYKNALITGDVSQLPDNLQQQALTTLELYAPILEAVATQQLGADSPVFAGSNPAGDRLRRMGSCGVRMRSVDVAGLRQQGDEAATLQRINEFLQTATDEQITEKFGEQFEPRFVRNGQPFQSKAEFAAFLSQSGGASLNSFAIWGKFAESSPPPETEQPTEEEEIDLG